jgi:hypothetical protein
MTKEMPMEFEDRVLDIVATVTDTTASFYEGSLFLHTADRDIAMLVYNALRKTVTGRLAFGPAGEFETVYDFLV